MATVALGFSSHSGWAVVVAVSSDGGRPRIVRRERLEMIDPGDADSKQPYHAVQSMSVGVAAERLAAYSASAGAMARAALGTITEKLGAGNHDVKGVGILESAGRKGVALAAILASHALLHTAEGDHFRDAIAGAAAGLGCPVLRVPARELEARVARADGRPIAALRRLLDEAGRPLGPPWGADQKAAALVAWLVLASPQPGPVQRARSTTE